MAPFLIVLMTLLIWPYLLEAAEKKVTKPAPAPPSSSSPVTDINLLDYFKAGEEQLKKGRVDEALRAFQGVYGYTRDNLLLLKCVTGAYEKALNEGHLNQSQKEEMYLKLQRIGGLTTRYSGLKGESAYNMGLIYRKKGDSDLARKYLLEACQTIPFSLDQTSTWMKSKNLFLNLSGLEGEF